MEKRILLGVDADLSIATQHALHMIGEFVERAMPPIRLILLHVIPLTHVVAPYPGGCYPDVPVMTTHRNQAEAVLRKARMLLEQRGIAADHIEEMLCVGVAADEIARIAREQQVTLIVIGSRGESFWQRLRRLFVGSISRRVLVLAPCPVMTIVVPRLPSCSQHTPRNLVSWYEHAITGYLHEHPKKLFVFTPQQVSQDFTPLGRRRASRDKTLAAASVALEQLAHSGVLFRHDVKGESRYVND